MNVYSLSNNLEIHLHFHFQTSGLWKMVKVGICLKAVCAMARAVASVHCAVKLCLSDFSNEVGE